MTDGAEDEIDDSKAAEPERTKAGPQHTRFTRPGMYGDLSNPVRNVH